MAGSIYIIRHGTTPANRENRFAGRTDEALHSEGVQQIGEISSRLQEYNIKKIYSGPLARTQQSAEIVARRCNVPFAVNEALTDIYLPHWDGLTKDEIRREFGHEYPTWLSCPGDFFVPGCETLADVQKRAVAAAKQIRQEKTGNLLLVSHLIVARCLILYDRGMSLQHFRAVKVDNGEVVRLENF